MNRRELILICLYEVILACLLFCGVGMIFHECDGENETIDAAGSSGRIVVVPGVVVPGVVESKGHVEEEYSGPGCKFPIPMLVCDDGRVFHNVVNYRDSD